MGIFDQYLQANRYQTTNIDPLGADGSLSPEMFQLLQAGGMGRSYMDNGKLYAQTAIQHSGEDAGTPDQVLGHDAFDPAHMRPGDSYELYGKDGKDAGQRKIDNGSAMDWLDYAVLAFIGGGAAGLYGGAAGSAVDGAGGMALQEGAYPEAITSGTGAGSTGAAGTGAGALGAGGGGGVEGTGAGLAGPASSDQAFNAALTDTAGGQGLASSDAAFNKALTDAGLNQSTWGQIASKLGLPSGLTGSAATQILSGLLSQYAGAKGTSLANKIMSQSDPFAGYRAYYGGKLMDLEKNPTSISSNPGFAVGEDALKRSMASQGYNGSGNMATALSDYSAKYFMDERAQLAGLAGANATPGAGSATAASLYGNSLATQNNGWIQLLKGLGSGFNLGGGGGGSGSDTGANPILTPSASGI